MTTATGLEPAIPDHLVTKRTQSTSLPLDYQPPFPAYAARFPQSTRGLVMAVIGCQRKTGTSRFDECREKLLDFMSQQLGSIAPQHWDLAAVIDKEGYHNVAALAYWPGHAEYERWLDESGLGAFWEALEPSKEIGWFMEIFSPSIDRLETVFSDKIVPEGIAHMRESTDALVGDHISLAGRDKASNTESRRVRVAGRKNLTMIRSGQDWSGTDSHERELYLETMHPVLIKSMDFLTHEGSQVGCMSNRFMEVIDPDGSPKSTEKTFGLGYFEDIAYLEGWSKHHKTHLNIFGRFIQYAKELENNVQLRLFHEVMVLQPEQQFFEYVGCHQGTGMLASH